MVITIDSSFLCQNFHFWGLQVLIGCDGVNSFVARKLGLTEPVNSGRSAVVALAVFPEGHGVREDVQQFVDVGKRGGIVPLNDKEIYWFLTFNTPKGWFVFANHFMTIFPSKIQLTRVLRDIVAIPSRCNTLAWLVNVLSMILLIIVYAL